MKKQIIAVALASFALTGLSIAPMSQSASATSVIKTTPAQPDADMQKVLTTLQSLHGKPIEKLTPQEARKQPTPSDAVKKVLTEAGKSTQPLAEIKTKDITYTGAAGDSLPARVYTPAGKGPFPVVVYYHGGGFVIATIDTYDASARAIAKNAKAIVVSIEYRHAPEHKFPAAHQDAFAAYQWVLAHANEWNGDSSHVAVAGESAGGNLAANVSIMARDKGIQAPLAEVLIYPVAGNNMNTPSYIENAKAKPLNKPMMAWFFKNTLKTPADKNNPMLDLVHANLKGLPPTTIITDQIDPLRSEGMMLAKQYQSAGVTVTERDYPGVTHEFFGMGAVVSKAKAAEKFVGEQLQQAFSQ